MKELQLREISYKQAKKEVEKYMSYICGGTVDASDIQIDLGINIFLAIEIFKDLENEGKIHPSVRTRNK